MVRIGKRNWGTLGYSWFEALDPASYGPPRGKDRGTNGALWCLDPTCANYYQYLERPLMRKCCEVLSDILEEEYNLVRRSWRINGGLYSMSGNLRFMLFAKQAGIKGVLEPRPPRRNWLLRLFRRRVVRQGCK